MIDLDFIIQSLPRILQGTLITLVIAALSCCIGLILGTICGFRLNSSRRLIR